jgi:hypothetical protein
MERIKVQEYRPDGARNYIRVGDTVRVASSPGRRDGHLGRIHEIVTDGDGEVIDITVVGDTGFRTYLPHRIQRIAQTKGGERRECVR